MPRRRVGADLEDAHLISLQLLSDRVRRGHELQNVGAQQVHHANTRVILRRGGGGGGGGECREVKARKRESPVDASEARRMRTCAARDRYTPAAGPRHRNTDRNPYPSPSLPFPLRFSSCGERSGQDTCWCPEKTAGRRRPNKLSHVVPAHTVELEARTQLRVSFLFARAAAAATGRRYNRIARAPVSSCPTLEHRRRSEGRALLAPPCLQSLMPSTAGGRRQSNKERRKIEDEEMATSEDTRESRHRNKHMASELRGARKHRKTLANHWAQMRAVYIPPPDKQRRPKVDFSVMKPRALFKANGVSRF